VPGGEDAVVHYCIWRIRLLQFSPGT